jgi:hypothetical protein
MWAAALVMNILHLVCHQLTTNLDFFPFNNVRAYTFKQKIAELSVNLISMGFPVEGFTEDLLVEHLTFLEST